MNVPVRNLNLDLDLHSRLDVGRPAMELGSGVQIKGCKRKALTIPNIWEERSKWLKYEVSSKDETIKRLQAKTLELQAELKSVKEAKLHQEVELKNERDDLKVQYFKARNDCTAQFDQYMEERINRPLPGIVVVKRKAQGVCDPESLQALQEQVQELQAENLAMKQHTQILHKSFASQVEKVSLQVQEAIKENAALSLSLLEKYKREIVKRKALHDTLVELRGNIRVYMRPKPLRQSEGGVSVFSHDPYDDTVVSVPMKSRSFQLEKVFSPEATQSEVFGEVSALIQSVLDGRNVCIFAYGQTGSGKTYTMEGSLEDPGVNQRALKLLYEETQSATNMTYEIKASMMEIYNETIRDLLGSEPNERLEVKMKPEGGLHVPGLVSVPVKSLTEINRISKVAQENRVTASTMMNERSSRSHCILCVSVEETNRITGSKSKGRLNLVDLAGSERVSKSQVEGARLKEAQSINRSLSCLGDVINALKNHHPHVPYRNSKLTYLLQESLGGDSKTIMILQASSHPDNLNETLSTLSFGQRVFSVELNSKNTPSSARRPQSETPSSARKFAVPNDNPSTETGARTPTGSLVKASSVPSRLNVKRET
ncbi:hypothetical protein RRG08_020821 [Elysia crispata]|uniref:Kinesin-like protein n=1 Tax=Elysia crispata TaxID=231223 RepID=A0AAE1CMF6_9GAST|nr:hypothetical protein RRG08_020821 [Elysia crispata]